MSNIKLKNGKYVVIVDVGSTVACNHIITGKVEIVDIENKVIQTSNGYLIIFDSLLDIKNSSLYSVNGIQTKDIDSVRIVGYNDKVILRIKDRLSAGDNYEKYGHADYSVIESFIYSYHVSRVVPFTKNNNPYILDNANNGMTIWYVNDKPYRERDLIVPTESEKVEEVKTMEITKDNVRGMLVHNEFVYDDVHGGFILSSHGGKYRICVDDGYYARFNDRTHISTTDFNEFLEFVQKRIDLKPLPKEKKLEYKLIEAGFNPYNESDHCKYFKKNILYVGIYDDRIQVSIDGDANYEKRCMLVTKPHEHDLVFKHIAYLEECYGDKK